MTRRLLLSYVLFVVFVLAVLEVPLGVSYQRSERRDLEVKVERDAQTIASLAEDGLENPHGSPGRALRATARSYLQETGGRIVIVNAAGDSVVDADSAPGRSFASRPEIAKALRGQIATGSRFSQTLHENLIYVAVPIASGGVVRGAARVTYPTATVDHRIRRYWLILAAIAGVVLVVAAAVGAALARSISKPMRELERAAEAAGAGDLAARAPESSGPKEVRALARAFNESFGKLQALVRAQEEFVADASHQLRTPLTALRLRLENLEHRSNGSADGDVAGALAEVERLTRLVGGLLVLARTNAEGAPSVDAVDLRMEAEERLAAWIAAAADHGVRLALQDDAAVPALSSRDRVHQILDNLLENAIQASPEGGTVTVRLARSNGWVELHVVDEGPGMSAEERARAFDRFWRGHKGGGGSGLGLAVVERLVTADGGEVELLPAPARGLDARVRFRGARREPDA